MIYTGDCLDILPTLDAESVQCCVTSPPYYGLRDYQTATWQGGDPGCDHKKPAGGGHGESSPIGKGERDIEIMTSQRYFNVCRKCGAVRTDNQIGLEPTPEAYVEKLVQVFREVRRVLRDDGTVFINLGDSYASRKGTCYNPGGGSSSLGMKRKEAGAHPLDRGNKSTLEAVGLKPKDLIGIPWRVAFALQADGWYLRQDIIWAKPNQMPESVTDRCTKAHEYIFLLTKSARYFYDAEAVKEPAAFREDDRPFGTRDSGEHGQPGRVYDSWKGSRFDDGKNLLNHPNVGRRPGGPTGRGKQGSALSYAVNGANPQQDHSGWIGGDGLTRNRRSVWTITTKPFKEAHFATFPPEITGNLHQGGE